jgi:hypothetical protein
MKIILKDIEPDDLILGIRAARWLLEQIDKKDAILCYGTSSANTKDFYVRRNKASVTVRPCTNPR